MGRQARESVRLVWNVRQMATTDDGVEVEVEVESGKWKQRQQEIDKERQRDGEKEREEVWEPER